MNEGRRATDCRANVLAKVIFKKWYLLGDPWAPSQHSGFTIYAGSPDPHVGDLVCDIEDIAADGLDVEAARIVASHMVELHNNWLNILERYPPPGGVTGGLF